MDPSTLVICQVCNAADWNECNCPLFTEEGYWGPHSNLLERVDPSSSLEDAFYCMFYWRLLFFPDSPWVVIFSSVTAGCMYFGLTPRRPDTRKLLHLAPIPYSIPSLEQLCLGILPSPHFVMLFVDKANPNPAQVCILVKQSTFPDLELKATNYLQIQHGGTHTTSSQLSC